MAELNILRVFIGEGEAGGNPLGAFLNGGYIADHSARQRIAAALGFSETVFVDDPDRGEVRIFTPSTELPFAGHPLVDAAWLLAREGHSPPALHPPAGRVPIRFEGDLTYIAGHSAWAPPFKHIRLDSPDEVDALPGPPDGCDLVGLWAWEDEEAGRIRARVFAPRLGVGEDEATGAHAVRLAARLGRGAIIVARPRSDGTVEIGGRTELVEVREYGQGGDTP